MEWELKFAPGELEAHYKTATANAHNPNHSVFRHILIDEPRIQKAERFYWNAFLQLGSMRPSTGLGGPSRIPWESIINYAKHYDLSFDETDSFVEIISEMDTTVLSAQDEKDKKANKSGK